MNTSSFRSTIILLIALLGGCRSEKTLSPVEIASVLDTLGMSYLRGTRDPRVYSKMARDILAQSGSKNTLIDSGAVCIFVLRASEDASEETKIVLEFGGDLYSFHARNSRGRLAKEEWSKIRLKYEQVK